MKHFTIMLCVCIVFTGCEQFTPSDQLIRKPSITFNSLPQIAEYTTTRLRYIPDDADRWQAPQETIERGGGDCEDFCLFVGYFARELGYDVYLVSIDTPEGSHMILEMNGVYYEAQGVTKFKGIEHYTRTSRESIENALRKCWTVYKSRNAS